MVRNRPARRNNSTKIITRHVRSIPAARIGGVISRVPVASLRNRHTPVIHPVGATLASPAHRHPSERMFAASAAASFDPMPATSQRNRPYPLLRPGWGDACVAPTHRHLHEYHFAASSRRINRPGRLRRLSGTVLTRSSALVGATRASPPHPAAATMAVRRALTAPQSPIMIVPCLPPTSRFFEASISGATRRC